MKRFRKYLLRILAIMLGIVLLLMIAIFTYVSLNKQKIIRQVTAELSKKINGQVSVGSVELSFFRNFPKVAVLLHDIKVTDSMYGQHHHSFLEAKEVFALISIKGLLKKQSPLNGIRVDHATLYIYTDVNGYSNNYLMKQKKEGSHPTPGKSEKCTTIHNPKRLQVYH